ncbi:glycoside hydrolase family 27 protein [Flavobacterium sp. ANB]|uniref:glycoside hydrolase family 27 protein n=1 Tax=unclassified Flavobacterium TaxID=196869 RepID=UPI0012B7E909|nr:MULTISPECIES: glycoside hydrolase family 27 protein [unclassified Flavobacterium]MBF4518002.1 glycoside hydrolase family 27 protein [Flavobacterium sp. ANB]MTD71254.1 glycoside hydrolase family 27 protein [Flavobacterium sp. LC2016-13]
MKKIILIVTLSVSMLGFGQGNTHTQAGGKFEGLAMTPPMGWNSWNTFGTSIDEKLVKETADIMVSSGMAAAGYKYIVLDDGWMTRERDVNGDLVPDPVKFPNGMKAVIDYVHNKGLKFGLYNCAGTQTCAGYPGTRGYEYQDARFYAKLGIDFLKYDWCNTKGITAPEAYTTMSNALKTAGRPIVFSLCEWGDNQPWEWGKPIGNLWRISGDIYPCFDCEFKHEEGNWSSWGFMKIVEMRKDIRKYSGPDHWNDFDMMEVGNEMNDIEDKSHFSMWCMMASPLVAGNDFRKMSKETLAILTNKELIAINQDKLGIQGFKYAAEDGLEVWLKPLSDGNWAVTFLNRSDVAKKINFDWKKHLIKDVDFGYEADFSKTVFKLKDLWKNKEIGNTKKNFMADLASHDVITLRLIP